MKESAHSPEIDNCHEKYKTVKYSVAVRIRTFIYFSSGICSHIPLRKACYHKRSAVIIDLV